MSYTIAKGTSVSKIQEAFKSQRDIKFANAKYNITSTLKVYSDTVIDLNGASLRRYTSGPIIRSYDLTSYTKYNGTHDVIIKNGTLEGMNSASFKQYGANSLSAWFHCNNIVFENVTFLDTTGCHSADVVACQNVTFRNCRFLGYCSWGNDFREAIQLDYAYHGGLPTYTSTAKCYDMTRCNNILIEGCTFDKSSSYPAQFCAIGSHTQGNDKLWHENITIKNCTANGNGGAKGWQGYFLSIFNYRNVIVENNKVNNYARFVYIGKPNKLYNSNGTYVSISNIPANTVQNLIVESNQVTQGGTCKCWGIYDETSSAKNVSVNNNNGLNKTSCQISGTSVSTNFVV